MAIYALIGGKVNREKINNRIEEKLLGLTKGKTPTVLYCPFAAKDIDKSILKFHSLMDGLNCRIIDLTYQNEEQFEELLKISDMLYIGGGISDDLIAYFREKKFDKILKKYEDRDIIYAGSSAGAMLFCKVSMGDKYMYSDNYHNYNYKMVHGLSLLNISMCPHYQNEDLIFYNDEIKDYGLLSFGIEEDCCLVVDGIKYFILKDDKQRSVYSFNPKEGYKMVPLYEGEIYENSSIRS